MSTAPSPQLEAYLEVPPLGESASATFLQAASPTDDSRTKEASEWKQQVAERLAAHRSRKGRQSEQQAMLGLDLGEASSASRAQSRQAGQSKVARVAAAVAARYAHAPSYRDLLAAQAEAALRQAEAAAAAAKAAVIGAEAAMAAQQAMLAGFEEFETQKAVADAQAANEVSGPGQRSLLPANALTPETDAAARRVSSSSVPTQEIAITISEAEVDEWLAEHEEVYAGPTTLPVPLPTNLIEFPRQLVASRKARPRLAEGPLREESDAAPENAQLRIFEVEAAIIATQPADASQALAAEWSSIRLDAQVPSFLPVFEQEHAATHASVAAQLSQPLQVAPLEMRVMAGAVDICLITVGFLAFAGAFLATTTHLPPPMLAMAASGLIFAAVALMYFALFFSLAESTPGMRYARIALCTFDDENPSRAAMRRRVAAMLLCACPLGLGFVWAWLDHDRLGWHDRLTRMYQRSY